jgi:hypothetical protein
MSDIARLDPEASLAPRNLGCGMTPTAGALYAIVMRQPALTGCREVSALRGKPEAICSLRAGFDVAYGHFASFRCRAAIRSLSDWSGHQTGFYEYTA